MLVCTELPICVEAMCKKKLYVQELIGSTRGRRQEVEESCVAS